MKEIVITPKQLKRELFVWLFCLVVATGMNIYAIIYYETNWTELYSHFGYVVMLSVIFYAIIWMFRGLFFLIRYLAGKSG
jgi:hypothetical protein